MESISKLKWRCRRGTKELDYLLENYLIKQFKQSNKEQQLLFITLLDLQDTQLIYYLLGNHLPESKGLCRLVKKIRNTSAIYN
ncbi:MAG: succinate dehydrogenase assembly factor 2 [Methylococcales symbiont of Hymedesmia sp. n. MRB-2018]|nr:MAG: succinate dehydrogenase assembly factor 2 [Methylococcales symbiont of Iophon sp. n. MRB-2018]KAF3980318.1 MAG: succinate dehydrogenase assembly factor 2 [Methylococcales symbiont of Iophon sp. n. MRB-2018]KAF3981959.1 MAG: succinate dehydrogenase assembly factor 2 [Methylococcales symbiont of Hymedesmia sp. n. MRB-2018]KAF3983878.1 MAG: succinate dehydrogenase assembly factor 2 [Methylococcales symbiont of Hymedesmia sp. n. MRB-2018]